MHRPLVNLLARDMQQRSHPKGFPLFGRMIAPDNLEIRGVMTNSFNRSRQVPPVCKGERAPPGRDVEVNDARIVYPNDCFVLEVQHHHGSQLLAAVMDRWLSCSRFGPNSLPRKYPHLTVSIVILRVTYMRLSETKEESEEVKGAENE